MRTGAVPSSILIFDVCMAPSPHSLEYVWFFCFFLVLPTFLLVCCSPLQFLLVWSGFRDSTSASYAILRAERMPVEMQRL